MPKVQEFVSRQFLARDMAHREHWKTRSFAAHSALGEFYGSLIELVDTFAEAYQGGYSLIGDFELMTEKGEIVPFLEAQVQWIESNRYEVCDKSETALQNLIDEIIAAYLKALYLLRFLK